MYHKVLGQLLQCWVCHHDSRKYSMYVLAERVLFCVCQSNFESA